MPGPKNDRWTAAVSTPVLIGERIIRKNRERIGHVALDGPCLAALARDGLGVIVDCCDPSLAVVHAMRAARHLSEGLVWLLVEDFETSPPPPPRECFAHPGHPEWR